MATIWRPECAGAYNSSSRGSRRILVCDEFTDGDSSRLTTVCGQFVSTANACSWTVETAMRSRMRTVCERDCGRGLIADVDCSRTCIGCVSVVSSDCSCLRNCRVCGHESVTLRGCLACSPRSIRGRRNLIKLRSKACTVSNMMRTTLPALLQQFVAPVLQLRSDCLDARGLLKVRDAMRADCRLECCDSRSSIATLAAP